MRRIAQHRARPFKRGRSSLLPATGPPVAKRLQVCSEPRQRAAREQGCAGGPRDPVPARARRPATPEGKRPDSDRLQQGGVKIGGEGESRLPPHGYRPRRASLLRSHQRTRGRRLSLLELPRSFSCRYFIQGGNPRPWRCREYPELAQNQSSDRDHEKRPPLLRESREVRPGRELRPIVLGPIRLCQQSRFCRHSRPRWRCDRTVASSVTPLPPAHSPAWTLAQTLRGEPYGSLPRYYSQPGTCRGTSSAVLHPTTSI